MPPDADTLTLCRGRLSVCVMPGVGGGISRFDWREGTRVFPLMRPCASTSQASAGDVDPNQLACYPLLPWSNRVAHGGFFYGGRWIALPRNRADDAYPIHGSAWQCRWQVVRHETHEVELALQVLEPDSYAYRATLIYRLHEDALRVEMKVTNAGCFPLPFGMGLHPFFPRNRETRIVAPAEAVWANDGIDPLPTMRQAVPQCWDFSQDVEVPAGAVNHAFVGWTGRAVIEWPDAAIRLHMAAEVDAYVLYVPAGRDFFCFEPADHPINAMHLAGGAVANGMTELAPGESLERAFVFRVDACRSEPEEAIR